MISRSQRGVIAVHLPGQHMDSSLAARLEKLETHVAHLERQFDELNGVVIGQGRELTRLRQLMQRVSASVEGIELDRIKATSAKPPHSVV